LKVPIPVEPEPPEPSSLKGKGKEKEVEAGEEAKILEDDGELGGEVAGRLVWEAFEMGLKAWEKENPPKPKEVGEREGNDSATPSSEPLSKGPPI
jgi:hypothetical protein